MPASLNTYIYLSISISIYLSISISIYLSLSIYLYIYLFYLSIYLSINLSIITEDREDGRPTVCLFQQIHHHAHTKGSRTKVIYNAPSQEEGFLEIYTFYLYLIYVYIFCISANHCPSSG